MIIYKTTNIINGKIYIGQDKYNNPNYFGSGLLLNRSINKYGKNNFIKEVVDESEDQKELNEKEKYWIKFLNSLYPMGYNIAEGGTGGDVFTNNPNKDIIRDKCSKPGEKNGMFGKHHTEESIKKISQNRKGKGKGVSTWNKGLTKNDYSPEYKFKVENQKRSKINKSNKTFILISPDEKLHDVYGGLEKFCKEQDFPFTTLRLFINRGKIPPPHKKIRSGSKRNNINGWEIRNSDYK